MKFNIEVYMEDLVDDIVCDQIEDFQGELKSKIIQQVMRKALSSMQDLIDKKISDRVNGILSERVESAIQKTLDNVVNNGIVNHNGSEVLITSLVKDKIIQDRSWNSVTSQIEKFAKSFSVDLKRQYDAAFANKVVANMKEQGLLKDDVVNILLGGQSSEH